MNIVPKHTTHGVYAVLIALLIQLFLSVPQAYASPVSDASFTLDSYVASNASANLAKRFRGDVAPRDPDFNEAPNVSDFPDTLDIQAAVRQNLGTTFVFWTEVPNREGSDRARQFARQVGGVYIRDAYPSNYICHNGRSNAWWMNFVDRVSGVYTDQVPEGGSATIYLVTASINGLVNDCGTFHRVEGPTLRERGYTTIIYVNAYDFSDRKEFSLVTGQPTSKRDLSSVTSRKVTNSVKHWSSVYCTNWQGYGDDPDSTCNPLQLYPMWSGGQCGVHIVQYRNANHDDPFGIPPIWPFNVTLKDSNQEQIGNGHFDIKGGNQHDMGSVLPYMFEVAPGLHGISDSAPVRLQYAGWSALTNGPACRVGGFDSGYRQMDCSFPCLNN